MTSHLSLRKSQIPHCGLQGPKCSRLPWSRTSSPTTFALTYFSPVTLVSWFFLEHPKHVLISGPLLFPLPGMAPSSSSTSLCWNVPFPHLPTEYCLFFHIKLTSSTLLSNLQTGPVYLESLSPDIMLNLKRVEIFVSFTAIFPEPRTWQTAPHRPKLAHSLLLYGP